MTFTVATRVVLGHSGNEALFDSRLPSLRIVAFLIIASTVMRAGADFLAGARPTGMNWAAYIWMIAAMIWAVVILPKVRIADEGGDAACKIARMRKEARAQ